MIQDKENPAALAGADRVLDFDRGSNIDRRDDNAGVADLQVRRILQRYAISLALALVVAEIAFSREARS